MKRALLISYYSCLLVLPALGAPKLTLSCGSNGIEHQMCEKAVKAWSKQTGVAVEVFSIPNDSNDRLAIYQQFLGAGSPDVDVYQIDVVWPGLLASHFRDLKDEIPTAEIAAHLPEYIRNNTVQGRLVAVPWFADGGVLYYRKDLLKKHGLKPPSTWDDLENAARTIAGKEKGMYGLVFQGRAYEGLTCNALEWVASHGGGTIVDEDGRVSVNNPNSVKALTRVAGWVGSLAPTGVLGYSEEEARGVFQSGQAIFMRNWPYAWALLEADGSPVRGKVGIVPMPKTALGDHASTLGGWSLAVSKYSKFPKEAVELVRYLTGAEQQRIRSLEASFNPTIVALYDDPTLLAKNPHLKVLKSALASAIPRPSRQTRQKYNRVSAELWNTVHAILSKTETPEVGLASLEKRLVSHSNGGKW